MGKVNDGQFCNGVIYGSPFILLSGKVLITLLLAGFEFFHQKTLAIAFHLGIVAIYAQVTGNITLVGLKSGHSNPILKAQKRYQKDHKKRYKSAKVHGAVKIRNESH